MCAEAVAAYSGPDWCVSSSDTTSLLAGVAISKGQILSHMTNGLTCWGDSVDIQDQTGLDTISAVDHVSKEADIGL